MSDHNYGTEGTIQNTAKLSEAPRHRSSNANGAAEIYSGSLQRGIDAGLMREWVGKREGQWRSGAEEKNHERRKILGIAASGTLRGRSFIATEVRVLCRQPITVSNDLPVFADERTTYYWALEALDGNKLGTLTKENEQEMGTKIEFCFPSPFP